MTFSEVRSRDGSLQLLALFDDLGDCTDPRQVLAAATTRFDRIFGEYAVYAVLLSDPRRERWRLLPLRNPEGPAWAGGVAVEDLPPDSDMDTLARSHGRDVTRLLREESPRLHAFLSESEEDAFTASSGRTGDGPLMDEVRGLLSPLDARTVLAASWKPPTGGRGCVLLGYAQEFLARDLLGLFALAIKVTTRLSLYPDYVNLVARVETISQSLRRGIVHDLKTPVTVMSGYAQTLLMPGVGEDPTTRQQMLTAISRQAERLLDDLNDLLAPVDAGWSPQLEAFDLASVLHRAVMAEGHTARAAATHRFEVAGADRPVRVTADRRKIRRVIENLLSNAVKYSPGENKTVRVELAVEGDTVRLSVSDDGIGMTEEQLARVLHGTGRVAEPALGIEGTGFGVDSCRRVLEAHGGTLWAISRVGAGSTFTVLVPRNGQNGVAS